MRRPALAPAGRALALGAAWLVASAILPAPAVLPIAASPAASAPEGRPAERVAELWQEPPDVASRDLVYGPGGRALAPRPDVAYRVVGLDTKGHSESYDVVDPAGRTWDVKIGDEAAFGEKWERAIDGGISDARIGGTHLTEQLLDRDVRVRVKERLYDEAPLLGRAKPLARHVGREHVAQMFDVAVGACRAHWFSRMESR